MFRNRHLNFGYLLVILVVFAISISASCKLAYAQTTPTGVLVIAIDVDTGDVVGAAGVPPAGFPVIPIAGQPAGPVKGKIIKVIPTVIITSVVNPNCITFTILGKQYTYCP